MDYSASQFTTLTKHKKDGGCQCDTPTIKKLDWEG
jgi:hypothetical protein